MQAVIIGVSKRENLGLNEKKYNKLVDDYARLLSKYFDNLIVTPDLGVYSDIALKFGELNTKKPIAYYPDKDKQYGIKHIEPNFYRYKLKKIDGDWYKLNAELTKKAPIVIMIGLSSGSVIEASYIKYHQSFGALTDKSLANICLLVDKRFIDSKKIFESLRNVYYYKNLNILEGILKKVSKK